MSDIELIHKCVTDLDSISVPIGLLQQIGVPIQNVRNNLAMLYNGILDNIEKQQKANETEASDNAESTDNVPEIRIEPDPS